eukprot:4264744-Heterocapsa_arctica.AAC.1
MEHDVDDSELAHFKERALNITERGGYEYIIMWSKIYHIKIESYCYSMDMQTIDGDEFLEDKSGSYYFIVIKADGENKGTTMT